MLINYQDINSYKRKKMKTKFISIAATMLFFAASVTSAFAEAQKVANSAVYVNGTWYYCATNLGSDFTSGGAFHGANLGVLESLQLGGQSQAWEDNKDWKGGQVQMSYKIDNGTVNTLSLNYWALQYYNNSNETWMKFQSGGGNFTPATIDISGLAEGSHTLAVWFHCDNAYDSNNSNNYVANFTKIPTVTLPNTGNVESTLNSYSNQPACVILNDRTLYSDKWNTLCLPFNLSNFTGTPLAGADVRYLSSSTFVEGYLTLNFQSSNEIQAGIPYIVKLNGNSVENPTFDNVSITTTTASSSTTDFVKFQGCFNSSDIEGNEYLYLGANSTLYYPKASITIDSFRAYFELIGITAGDPTSPNGIKAFVLNFGDDTNSIQTISNETSSNDDYYTIDGRHLNGTPATAGIYIHNGRKVMIK